MRFIFASLAVASVAACSPTVPDSAAGVGFEDYDTYLAQQRARDAQLARGTTQVVAPVTPPNATPQTEAEATAAAAVHGKIGNPKWPATHNGVL